MVAWYWILGTAVITNFLTIILSNKIDFETFWEEFISILFYPLIWLGIFPYVFFRCVVRPVSQQHFDKIVAKKTNNETIHKLSKNIYLWHDKETKRLHHHWFLIRVKDSL